MKLREVLASGVLGTVLSVRMDSATGSSRMTSVWPSVPRGTTATTGGGIVLDMFCHFRYLLDHLFGGVGSILCVARTEVPRRVDETGRTYEVTAEDSAYALAELAGGAMAQISAWCVRPYRDDLLVVHVDGASGSAIAGLRDCQVQPAATTPVFVWNPDVPQEIDPRSGWLQVPDRRPAGNAFRRQWELFLRHVVLDEPFPWDLRDAVRGVQLAELAMLSSSERHWVEVPELPA